MIRVESESVPGAHSFKAGNGPDLLFLHPAGSTPITFNNHLDKLANDYHILAPNLYRLASVTSPLTYSSIAENLDRVVREQGFRELTIVGCSLGGGIGLAYSALHPESVQRLIVCEPSGIPVDRSFPGWIKAFIRMNSTNSKLPNPNNQNFSWGEFFYETRTNPKGVLKGLTLARLGDLSQLLPKIKIPVDILWAEETLFLPSEQGARMQTMVSGARLRKVSDLGDHHWFYRDPRIWQEHLKKTQCFE